MEILQAHPRKFVYKLQLMNCTTLSTQSQKPILRPQKKRQEGINNTLTLKHLIINYSTTKKKERKKMTKKPTTSTATTTKKQPQPRTVFDKIVPIRISADVLKMVKQIAKIEDRSATSVLRRFVTEGANKYFSDNNEK